MRRIIETLASPALAGRLSGTTGARTAAELLAAELAGAGLLPAATEGWLQPVLVPAARLLGAPLFAVNGRRLAHRRDFAEHAAHSGGGVVQGPLRVLDLAAPLAADRMPGAVLLLPETPPALDLAAMARAAAARGAAALLFEAGEPRWFYKTVHAGGGPLPLLRLRRSLAQELAQAQESTVSLDLPLSHAAWRCHNVVGRLPGQRPGATLLLAAHYDHVGDDPGRERFPGAFDNASGVAVALAVAQALAARRESLPFDLVVAFLTGEESGLWGARKLAATTPLTAAINVDGIGDPAASVLRLGHAGPGDWLAELAAAELPQHGLETHWIDSRDDSLAFREIGLPTLGLGQQPSAIAMHTPGDRPALLDFTALESLRRGLVGLIDRIAAQSSLPFPSPAEEKRHVYA